MEICGVSHFESKFMPVLGLASNDNFVDVVAMVVWDLSEKNPWTNGRPMIDFWGVRGLKNMDLSATFKYLEYNMNHVSTGWFIRILINGTL